MKGNGGVYVTSTNILHLLLYDTFTQLPFLQYKNMMYSERNTSYRNPQEALLSLCLKKNTQLFLPLEESHAQTCAISTRRSMSMKCVPAMHSSLVQ